MKNFDLNQENIKKIKKLISLEKYKYISFDIFDTLIKRKVDNPKAVFNYMENKVLRENSISIKKFYLKRILAEKISHRIYNEPNIYQIYSFFPTIKKVKSKLIALEIETEKFLTMANPIIFDLYQFCLNNNKKIIITSDMYIPKEMMQKILNNSGYKGYSKLYISCDVKKSKRKGTIYPYILEDLNIKNENLIHIGDNIISDIENAKNIDSIYVKGSD